MTQDPPLAMTRSIESLIAHGVATLAPSSDSPRTDAMLLLAQTLQCERAWIVAHGEAEIASAPARRFKALCDMRATGVPLAYVLGRAGFYGREFVVDERVLVPRPETEHLIDEALTFLKGRRSAGLRRGATVLDVGTGSGAIACTIAAEDDAAFVEGTDVSSDAVDVARLNAQRLNVADRCRIYCGPFGAPVTGRRFDLVLANLPYVPTRDIPSRPNPVAFEPREALDGGADGLDAYRGFVPALPGLLEPGAVVLLEAAPAQVAGLVELVQRTLGDQVIEVGRDFGGRARYVKIATISP